MEHYLHKPDSKEKKAIELFKKPAFSNNLDMVTSTRAAVREIAVSKRNKYKDMRGLGDDNDQTKIRTIPGPKKRNKDTK